MKPKKRYQHAVELSRYNHDPEQIHCLEAFDALHDELMRRIRSHKFFPKVWQQRLWVQPIRGLYLWGGVGVGKTFLMDLFYESLPFKSRKRMHFHRFMQQVHQEMQQYQGQKDPLQHIANIWSREIDVLCLDEFMVLEITDAMILAQLLNAFFSKSITLVTTSNVPPHLLYENGLQRQRFLPAIKLLQDHCESYELKSQQDYRLRLLTGAKLYRYPLTGQADQYLKTYFDGLVSGKVVYHHNITVNQRPVQTVRVSASVVWFDFKNLCTVPRSQQDYLELARCYHTMIVSDVPQLSQDDWARNFIHLVDVLYDHRVKLILTAAVSSQELYKGKQLAFEFQRTLSRLTEIQSKEYLSEAHLP